MAGNAEEEAQEAVQRRALPSPEMPSLSEVREHKTTHCPYRSWCDECVEAFGREWPHQHREGPNGRTIPVIHMDYAFLTEKGFFRRAELSDAEVQNAITVIVGYDSGSKGPFMHVVPVKGSGADKFAAERIVEDIVFLGHTRVLLRSDNEPALLQLVGDALKGLRVNALDCLLYTSPSPRDRTRSRMPSSA